MVEGAWTGTMNLTEPHCGTDLGLLRTKAVKQARRQLQDHRHQDFHLRRRARPGREHHPSGAGAHRRRARRHQGHLAVRRAEDHGQGRRLARRSATASSCGSIEEKMGIHGNATCVMNYDGATGWLIGEENRGLPRHVHDDERGPPRRRRAGPGAIGSRLSERRDLRQGAPAGPRASPAPNIPTSRPIRSSCIPTCAAC